MFLPSLKSLAFDSFFTKFLSSAQGKVLLEEAKNLYASYSKKMTNIDEVEFIARWFPFIEQGNFLEKRDAILEKFRDNNILLSVNMQDKFWEAIKERIRLENGLRAIEERMWLPRSRGVNEEEFEKSIIGHVKGVLENKEKLGGRFGSPGILFQFILKIGWINFLDQLYQDWIQEIENEKRPSFSIDREIGQIFISQPSYGWNDLDEIHVNSLKWIWDKFPGYQPDILTNFTRLSLEGMIWLWEKADQTQKNKILTSINPISFSSLDFEKKKWLLRISDLEIAARFLSANAENKNWDIQQLSNYQQLYKQPLNDIDPEKEKKSLAFLHKSVYYFFFTASFEFQQYLWETYPEQHQFFLKSIREFTLFDRRPNGSIYSVYPELSTEQKKFFYPKLNQLDALHVLANQIEGFASFGFFTKEMQEKLWLDNLSNQALTEKIWQIYFFEGVIPEVRQEILERILKSDYYFYDFVHTWFELKEQKNKNLHPNVKSPEFRQWVLRKILPNFLQGYIYTNYDIWCKMDDTSKKQAVCAENFAIFRHCSEKIQESLISLSDGNIKLLLEIVRLDQNILCYKQSITTSFQNHAQHKPIELLSNLLKTLQELANELLDPDRIQEEQFSQEFNQSFDEFYNDYIEFKLLFNKKWNPPLNSFMKQFNDLLSRDELIEIRLEIAQKASDREQAIELEDLKI